MAELVIAQDEQVLSVLYDRQGLTLYPGGVRIAPGSRAIRAGDLIAIDTSTDFAIVAKQTRVRINEASGQSVIDIDDTHPWEVGDAIDFDDGSGQESEVIASIDYTNSRITLVGTIGGSGFDANDIIRGTANNTSRVIGIALETLRAENVARDGFIGKAGDLTPASRTTMYGQVAITGRFHHSRILNFIAGDTIAGVTQPDLDMGGKLIAAGDIYVIQEGLAAPLEL